MAGDPRKKGAKGGGSKAGKPEAETVSAETLVLLAPHGISALTLASEPSFLAKVIAAQKLGRTPGQSTATLISALVRLRAEEIAERRRIAQEKLTAQRWKLAWAWIGWLIVLPSVALVLFLMFGNHPMIKSTWDYFFPSR